MKRLRKLIKKFFGFTTAQTNGFVGLLVLLMLVLFSEPLYRWWLASHPSDFSKESVELDSLIRFWNVPTAEANQWPVESKEVITFFEFDPNNVSIDELLLLGFSKNLSQQIVNYRKKGGVFRLKSDLRKIYGMDSTFYQMLVPYIQLPESFKKTTSEIALTSKPIKAKFNLNDADTTQLKSIYGIGSVLAKRIVTYRHKLGGFVKMEQLMEVYRLDTAVIAKLTKACYLDENFAPEKININTVEEATLKAHPYISDKIAKAILAYRFQHGNFQAVEDIKKVKLVDEVLFNKIYPYVSVE
jgi:competence protein ComEA